MDWGGHQPRGVYSHETPKRQEMDIPPGLQLLAQLKPGFSLLRLILDFWPPLELWHNKLVLFEATMW